MKKASRILSLILCLVLFVSFAAGGKADEAPGLGDGIEWDYNSATHTLSFTGSGRMKTWDEYWNSMSPEECGIYYRGPWTPYYSDVTKVLIGAGIEYVDIQYLQWFPSLRLITVEEGSKSYLSECGVLYSADQSELLYCPPQLSDDFEVPDAVKSIAPEAFMDSGIKSVVIPESVVSIGEYAFLRSKITSVDLRARIELIPEYCFSQTQMLKEIVSFPGTLKTIGECAFLITSLEKIVLPEGLETIRKSAFGASANCTELYLPSTLKTIGDDNFDHFAITGLTIPGSVEKIGENCFSNCSGLKSVTFSEGLKELGGDCFASCPELREAVLPESLEMIERRLFRDCKKLKSVTVLNPYCGYAEYIQKNSDELQPLSPDFDEPLEFDEDGIRIPLFPSGVLIRAYSGSPIEKYALKRGYEFESIGTAPELPEKDPESGKLPTDGDGLKWIGPVVTLTAVFLLALAVFVFAKEKTPKKYVIYWWLALAGTFGAAYYPLSMGVNVLSQMIINGTVRSEDYPKYVIPYTPISVAVILGVLLMPAAIKILKKFALPVSGVLSIGAFYAVERLLETRITVTSSSAYLTTATEVTKRLVESDLGDWQMYMCSVSSVQLRPYEVTIYTSKAQKVTEIISGNYDPLFKLHFYLISAVLIVAILTCLYGFGRAIKEKRTNTTRLAILSVLTAAFLGMCIWACFTAFYRSGELEISALSATLMALFFILLGSTVGVSFACLFRGKGKFLSAIVPTVLAGAATLTMYIGEMILLKGHLYRYPGGFFFEGITGIVLAPADILVIVLSSALTLVFCLVSDKKKNSAQTDETPDKEGSRE